MSLNLLLWKNFTKKSRSTARPSGAADYNLNVHLKEETSLDKPTFLLDSVDDSCNYAAFNNRYYFIEDIVKGITGQYEVRCVTDYAATHRTAIGNSTFFVERSSAAYNVNINDNFVSQKQTYQIDEANVHILSGTYLTFTGGSYIIRVVGKQASNSAVSPGVISYLVSPGDLKLVLDFLFNENNFNDILTDAVVKSFFNPFQYIVDVRWVPFDIFSYELHHSPTPTIQNIVLGWWDTLVSGMVIENMEAYESNLPTFTRRYNDFRDLNSNWTRFKLYVPLIGNIDIDPIDYYAGDLKAHYFIDPLAGKGIFVITHGNVQVTNIIYQTTFEFGVPVQIGQMATDLLKIGSETASAIGNAVAGNIAGAAAAGVNAVMNAIQPTASVKGQTGSRMSYSFQYISVERYTADSGEIPLNNSGRPLCEHRQISTIPGYIKCADADIGLGG